MTIHLTVHCPECGVECMKSVHALDQAAGNSVAVDISFFEQETFVCDSCQTTFFTGDMELYTE